MSLFGGNRNVVAATFVAKDQASKDIANLRKNISSLGSKTGGPLGGMIGGFSAMNLGAGAAIGALGGAVVALQEVGKFLGEGVKMAMEEEKSLARLDTALKNNVENWNGNRDAIDQAIEKRMDLAFADDDLRDSLSKLIVATNDEEEALRLQNLAMDVARGRNIDLAAATDIVVKANMGNVGALRRLGIQIDKNATAQEATNLLMEKYTGQAAAYGETLEGSLKAADIQLQEMQESLGTKLLPLFKDVATTASEDVLPALEDLVDVVTGDFDMSNSFLTQFLNTMSMMPGQIGAAAKQMIQQAKVDEAGQAIYDKIAAVRAHAAAQGGETGEAIALSIGNKYYDTIKTIRFGPALSNDLVSSLKNTPDAIESAMDAVTWAIKHPLQLAKQTAAIEGALTTLEYKRGLASNTPEVNAVIDQQIQNLQQQWSSLTGVAYQKGVNASDALERGLRTFTPPILPVFAGIRGKVPGRNAYDPGHHGPGGRARGGDAAPYESLWVGEEGPELLTFGSRGGTIHPAGGGGGVTIIKIGEHELIRIVDEGLGRKAVMSPSTAYTR